MLRPEGPDNTETERETGKFSFGGGLWYRRNRLTDATLLFRKEAKKWQEPDHLKKQTCNPRRR